MNWTDSHVCESVLLPDNVFLLWADRKKERKKGRQRQQGEEGGKNPLHCTQESTCSALWECLDISSNGSAWEKKGKVILYALTAAGWSEGAGPNLT